MSFFRAICRYIPSKGGQMWPYLKTCLKVSSKHAKSKCICTYSEWLGAISVGWGVMQKLKLKKHHCPTWEKFSVVFLSQYKNKPKLSYHHVQVLYIVLHLVCFKRCMLAGSHILLVSKLWQLFQFLSFTVSFFFKIIVWSAHQENESNSLRLVDALTRTNMKNQDGLQFCLWSSRMPWSDWVTSLGAAPQNVKNEVLGGQHICLLFFFYYSWF